MSFKISRRDFLKSTVALPAWSIFPGWPVSPPPLQHDLFAIDFVWQCYDPHFEYDLAYYQSGGPGLFGDYFDDDQINCCIKNGSFRHPCKERFLIRGFLRTGKSGVPSQNRELASDDLRSKNPLSTFNCPECGSGWWLGHVAEGFEETFFFSQLENWAGLDESKVSKVITPPPAGTTMVRIGNEESMARSHVPAEHLPQDPIDLFAWVLKFEKGECSVEDFEKIERQWCHQQDESERIWEFWETEHRRQWAECNQTLPNKPQFGNSDRIRFIS